MFSMLVHHCDLLIKIMHVLNVYVYLGEEANKAGCPIHFHDDDNSGRRSHTPFHAQLRNQHAHAVPICSPEGDQAWKLTALR